MRKGIATDGHNKATGSASKIQSEITMVHRACLFIAIHSNCIHTQIGNQQQQLRTLYQSIESASLQHNAPFIIRYLNKKNQVETKKNVCFVLLLQKKVCKRARKSERIKDEGIFKTKTQI